MAQADDPKTAPRPLELSRYCVPFTPFDRKLEDVSICIVSTAGVRLASDRPFEVEGDTTWRVIPGDVEAKDLRYDDAHYDHACVDRDLNCVFPIDRVRELAAERRVGGLTANHFSLGYSQALRDLREKTIPALARDVDRERPGAVLLTGG
jgi:D-proline reductase (dithiol) PrdB